VLFSDTVGFISELPVQVIESMCKCFVFSTIFG
jgi:50S ribosomal subunit-associated GTPase HflX